MEVVNKRDGRDGLFYIEGGGVKIARMSYYFQKEGTFIIEHTEVNVDQEGKGLGRLLVKAAVDYARENQFKISPMCTYDKAVFNKTIAYQDVLA